MLLYYKIHLLFSPLAQFLQRHQNIAQGLKNGDIDDVGYNDKTKKAILFFSGAKSFTNYTPTTRGRGSLKSNLFKSYINGRGNCNYDRDAIDRIFYADIREKNNDAVQDYGLTYFYRP